MPPKKPQDSVSAHTIADHAFGDFFPHEHDGEADHDHDDIDPGPLEDNPIWQRDNVTLSTVGIDVGSSGTQVIFSQIHLQRLNDSLASRYVIVERVTEYESPVSFTPFLDQKTIDAAALGRIIDDAYAEAGILPRQIDIGVVILTGEALRRDNAAAVAEVIAGKGGEFVTATAGNHMEAMLAAFGSGAAKVSHDQANRILNIDIGGGTTKLALLDQGKIAWTAALDIGGRLLAVKAGRLVRLDAAGALHARNAGFDLKLGQPVADDNLNKIAAGMARALATALADEPIPTDIAELFLTNLPDDFSDIAGVMVSGGVAEYVYGRESRNFGDLGFYLGRHLAVIAEQGGLPAALLPADAGIRATALGASEYSVQLSGQTGTITSPGRVLPRRNMQVLKPRIDFDADPTAATIETAIRKHYAAFDLDIERAETALAFDWRGSPDYQRIRALADGIQMALSDYLVGGGILYVMLDGDIAYTLGGILQNELAIQNDMLVIDGIILRDFDYIDLGKIRLPSFTVPLTVKSLLFREELTAGSKTDRIFAAGDTAGRQHHHQHSHGHQHHRVHQHNDQHHHHD
jgi:ethanolamine utilization protein EutA